MIASGLVSLDISSARRENFFGTMARGWGRSEEDLPGDKEHARGPLPVAQSQSPEQIRRLKKRRSIELSLARIEEQLARVHASERRKALESAREELRPSLKEI
jgi:hypothetical protein